MNTGPLCAGSPLTLSVTNPVGGATYNWFNPLNQPAGTGATITITSATTAHSGTWQVFVSDPNGCDPVRDALRALLQGRQRRLHWRNETAPRRTKIAAAISAMGMTAVVVVGVPIAENGPDLIRGAVRPVPG